MRATKFCALIIFAATSISSAASPSADEIVSKYSLEQLDNVATYGAVLVTVGVDAKLAKKTRLRILRCDPSAQEIDRWMMSVKSLIDSKMEKERELYLAKPADVRVADKKWQDCTKSCTCGAYAGLIQGIDKTKLTLPDQNLAMSLLEKQGAQSDGAALGCSRRAAWFCKSDLRKYLKALN